MLASTPNPNVTDPPFQFEVLHHAMNQTKNKTYFGIRKLICGQPNTTEALTCDYYQMTPGNYLQTSTVNKPRHMEVLHTDFFSYAVVSLCYNLGVAHYMDYLVLSREKEPSMFTRTRMLKGLREGAKLTD